MARPFIFSPCLRENMSGVRLRMTSQHGGAVRSQGKTRWQVAATLWTAGHS
jgi:hypothetical protein